MTIPGIECWPKCHRRIDRSSERGWQLQPSRLESLSPEALLPSDCMYLKVILKIYYFKHLPARRKIWVLLNNSPLKMVNNVQDKFQKVFENKLPALLCLPATKFPLPWDKYCSYLLEYLSGDALKLQVPKCGPGTPVILQAVERVKSNFMAALRYYLPFSLSFFHSINWSCPEVTW